MRTIVVNAIAISTIVLAIIVTYDVWFKGWPRKQYANIARVFPFLDNIPILLTVFTVMQRILVLIGLFGAIAVYLWMVTNGLG